MLEKNVLLIAEVKNIVDIAIKVGKRPLHGTNVFVPCNGRFPTLIAISTILRLK